MIVELVGPPGVGKSTVAGHLAGRLGAHWVNLTGYFHPDGTSMTGRAIRFDRIASLVLQPRLAGLALRCWRREGTGEGMSWTINLARRNRAAKRLTGSYVLEEGPVHALALYAAGGDHRPFETILTALALPDALVILSAEVDTVVDRLRSRGEIWSERADDGNARAVRAYVAALGRITPMLRVPVIETNATSPPEEVATRLAARVNLACGGSASG